MSSHLLVGVSRGVGSLDYLRRKLSQELVKEDRRITLICEEDCPLRQFLGVGSQSLTWINALGLVRESARNAVRAADRIVVFWDGESLTDLVFEARRLGKSAEIHPVETTKVVNRNTDSFDVYIGRGSIWGNPFRVGTQEGEYAREEAINLFRRRFEEELLPDPPVQRKLLALRGARLGCYCKPLACHGDVIASYLNNLDPENLPKPRIEPSISQPEGTIPDRGTNPSHLFVSYASEDVQLAKWLARKLAAAGYAVWFDELKLLGGEPWPRSIDEAIKNRTFRMLALMSTSSIYKPNPSKERTLALAVGRRRQIADFLITLKVDNADLDWLTNDISYIAFNRSWADGLRRLLKKLDAIGTPKALESSSELVRGSLPNGAELVSATPENLRANVTKVSGVPLALKAFSSTDILTETELHNLANEWACYRVRPDYFISFEPPPTGMARSIEATKEQWSWVDVRYVHGINTRNVVANLIVRTMHVRLARAGCLTHPKQRDLFYLPQGFTEDGLLRFTDYRNRRTWLKIRGTATFVRPGKPREQNFHHFAFRLAVGRGLDNNFWIQISPTLFFFDAQGEPIVDKRVGARRRRLTRNWWNHKWLNRLIAVEQLLLAAQPSNEFISLTGGLHTLESPRSIVEAQLTDDSFTEQEEQETIIEDLDADSSDVEDLETATENARS